MHINEIKWEYDGRPQGATLLYDPSWATPTVYSRVAPCGRPLVLLPK